MWGRQRWGKRKTSVVGEYAIVYIAGTQGGVLECGLPGSSIREQEKKLNRKIKGGERSVTGTLIPYRTNLQLALREYRGSAK